MKVSLVVLLATMHEVWASGDDASRNQNDKRRLNGYYYPVQSPTHYGPYYKTPYPTHTPPTPYPTGRRPTPHPTAYPVPYPTPRPTYPGENPYPGHTDPYNTNPYDPYYNPYPPQQFRTPEPTPLPTPNPTPDPTPQPTVKPTLPPTSNPTASPTDSPSTSPSDAPSPEPSPGPSPQPSPEPSAAPSEHPSAGPSDEPSQEPSSVPSAGPSIEPSESPTFSEEPSESPTESQEPSENPTTTEEPSESPTESLEPTEAGTAPPTEFTPDPTIYDIICDIDNANTYGLLCAFVSLFPDLVILLGGPDDINGRADVDAILSRASGILDPTGNRKLQDLVKGDRKLQASSVGNNLGLIASFLDAENVLNAPIAVEPELQELTLFAPTNVAFITAPDGILAQIVDPDGQDLLYDILLLHVHDDAAVPFNRLFCGLPLDMANGKSTTTRCFNGFKFQVGDGNGLLRRPEIIARNLEASNGLIHTVDEVILPAVTDSPSMTPSSMPSISSSPSAAPSISSAPSVSSAPSAKPSRTPSSIPSSAPSAGPSTVPPMT